MSIVKANKLFKEGSFKEAADIYKDLYNKTKLDMYKFGLELSQKKLNEKENPNKIGVSPEVLTSESEISESKKILFVTAGLKGPTAGGGIATCFHNMIKNIKAHNGKEVDVIYVAHPYYAKEDYNFWKKRYKESCNANLIVIEIPNNDYGSKEMKRSYAVLKYLIDNESLYKSVIFHDFMGLAYYSVLAKRTSLALYNLEIIISAHGNHTLSNFFGEKKISHWDQKAIIFMEKESLRYADMITTPSAYYKNWIIDNFDVNHENILVMPNIIYEESEHKQEIKVNFKDKTNKLIVFYGRMERLKGVDLFIETIIENEKKGNKYNILFAGVSSKIDGKDAKDYINSKMLNVKSEIVFLFNCKANELLNYVKSNKGRCVFPTLGETSSCVVVECILHGVPFLASAIPGIKELVAKKHQGDFLFATGSVESFSAKIESPLVYPTPDVLSFDMKENCQNWFKLLKDGQQSKPIIANSIIENPLVSVVIPTNDRPELLEDALHSIREQNYSNIEILIVDDASEDRKLNQSIADKFNAKYIYLSEKSYKGAACNIGVSLSKGEYICFFDDDDIAHPEMINRYVTAFMSNNVDVISGFAAVFEHDNYIKNNNTVVPEYTSLALGGGLEVNLHINFFGKGTFIIKKESFLKVGGYEIDKDKVPMVDYRFYIKAALSNLNILIIPTEQYYYRKNSPHSLFYKNLGVNNTQYLAKHSIQKIIESKLGNDVGAAISSMIWDISLPFYK